MEDLGLRLFSLLRASGVAPAKTDAEITNVTDRPERVQQGTLFVCIRGDRTDGALLWARAAERGAAALVSETPLPFENTVLVPNSRKAYSELCAAFYGRPDQKLRLIGITGTNGKTTTAHYIRCLLERAGRRCALIGTLGADTGAGEIPTGYTTPEPDAFFAALAAAAENKYEYCVCEVSSQALAQYRVDGARFRLGVFTNIGSDHLDYHKTTERLVAAKRRLCALSDAMLLNADDAYCDAFAEAAGNKKTALYTCRSVLADYAAKNIRPEGFHTDYILFNGKALSRVRVNAPGTFSVYNSLAAAAACMMEGIPLETLAPWIAELPQVPGRMQRIEKNGITFIVDFAHTPDALSAALTALRPCTKGKLIAVFGCGGDRDKTKRPVMGRIAATLADEVILTSDNPRSEDPLAIIAEIRGTLPKKYAVFTEPDREAAIRLAYQKAAPGDTVLVAGKGHENTRIAGGEILPFSDAAVIGAL